MKLILAWAGGIFGLLVLVLGGVLIGARPDTAQESFMVGLAGTRNTIWLYRAFGGTEQRISEIFDATTINLAVTATSPDGAWLYVNWVDYSRSPVEFGWYRVRADGREWRPLVKEVWRGDFSPDARWLIYPVADAQGEILMALSLDDPAAAPIPLTSQRPPPQQFHVDSQNPAYFSPDGAWVYFRRCGSRTCSIDRARLDGSHYETLVTAAFPGGASLIGGGGDWLVVYLGNEEQYYQMRADGSDRTPVFRDTTALADAGQIPFWLVEQGLVILVHEQGQQTAAIHLATREVVWDLPAITVQAVTPDEAWILMTRPDEEKDQYVVERMHPDGSERKVVTALPAAPTSLGWASDGAWIYLLGGSDAATKGVWRMDILTGEQRRLLGTTNFGLQSWSPGHRYLVFSDTQLGGAMLFQLDVVTGTVSPVSESHPVNIFGGWGPKFKRDWSPLLIGLCGLGSLLLIILAPLGLKLGRSDRQ